MIVLGALIDAGMSFSAQTSAASPFWHDLLESLFGLKNRIRAQAEQVRERARNAGSG
jgi:hypothetical protein